MEKEKWRRIHAGEVVEVSQADFDEFLEMLPPAFLFRKVRLACGEEILADYGYAEGGNTPVAFFRRDGRHFAAQLEKEDQ